jgi:exodeoxyribonuclease V alpha subunit
MLKFKTEEDLIKYLSSDLFKGIGEVTAKAIVETLGLDALNLLELDLNIVSQLKLRPYIREKIQKAIKAYSKTSPKNYIEKLFSLGVAVNTAYKLIFELGSSEIDRLFKNPVYSYVVLTRVDGVGFKLADKVAVNLGVKDSWIRILAGVNHLSKKLNLKGHHYFFESELVRELLELFSNSGSPVREAQIKEGIKIALDKRKLYYSDFECRRIKYHRDYWAESTIAKIILDRHQSLGGLYREEIEEKLTFLDFASTGKNKTNEGQKNAFRTVLNSKTSIITGGAGVGKSWLVSQIFDFLVENENQAKVELAAPTGKAAQRLTELCKQQASTLHRLMGFKRGQFTVKTLDCDWLIIDEMSMIDSFLLENLLLRLPENTNVILVGDHQQLPAIGGGAVLKDLIKSKTIPVCNLTEVVRQSQRTLIPEAANQVIAGIIPTFPNYQIEKLIQDLRDGIGEDTNFELGFVESNSIGEDIYRIINQIQEHNLTDINSGLVVLAPSYKHDSGVDNLNRRLQDIFNPPSPDKKQHLRKNGEVWREGDRIMCLANEYGAENLLVANGEVGFISSVQDEGFTVQYLSGQKLYYDFVTDNIKHNFAMSIHKSQGSEYITVIVVLDNQHRIMLSRQLLDTAMTRAKRDLILVGSKQALANAVANNKPDCRRTELG